MDVNQANSIVSEQNKQHQSDTSFQKYKYAWSVDNPNGHVGFEKGLKFKYSEKKTKLIKGSFITNNQGLVMYSPIVKLVSYGETKTDGDDDEEKKNNNNNNNNDENNGKHEDSENKYGHIEKRFTFAFPETEQKALDMLKEAGTTA